MRPVPARRDACGRHEGRRGAPTVIELAIGLGLGILVAALVAPDLIGKRKRERERAAMQALHEITSAEATFRETAAAQDGRPRYATLAELASAGLIESRLGTGARAGYLFRAAPSTNTPEHLWFCVADPAAPGVSGDVWLATNQSGVTFYKSSEPFALDTDGCRLPTEGAHPFGGK